MMSKSETGGAIMDKLGEIRFTQPRTAEGLDDSRQTRIYAYVWSEFKRSEVLFTENAAALNEHPSTVFGFIEIVHPAIMWGSREEHIGDYVRACKNHLMAHMLPGMYASECGMLCYED